MQQKTDQSQRNAGGSDPRGLRDIRSALNDITQAVNALAKQVAASGSQFASVLTLTNPTTVTTAAYTVLATDTSIIAAGTGPLTLTLLDPSTVPGRLLFVKNTVAFAVNSATANVVPLVGGAASTAIVSAAAGKFVIMQSDGTVWQTMAGN